MKKNKKRLEKIAFMGSFGGMILMACAVLKMCSEKTHAADMGDQYEQVRRFRAALPNYADSVVAYDKKNAPIIDSLQNKIRAAESEEEIDYADFGRLIKISTGRDELLRKKARVDELVRHYSDSLANVHTK